jgi:purine-binding chemotaxis protein CheW
MSSHEGDIIVAAYSQLNLHSLVVFRVGDDSFAVPVDAVAEVVPIAWLSRPPHMPFIVHGILNLGGVAVPVLRTDRLLGMADSAFGLDASILVMKGGSAPLGLLVGHVEGVRPAAEFEILPLADRQSFQGCLAAELDGPGGCIHLVAWDKMLLEEERLRLDQFQRQTQDRLADLAEMPA